MWTVMLAGVIALASSPPLHPVGVATVREGALVARDAQPRRAPAARAANREPATSRRARAPARRDDQASERDDQASGRDEPRDAPGDPPGAEHAADRRASEAPAIGPTIGAVLAAAYAAAGLDRDPPRSWIRRARLAGLVPWVTVRTTRDTSWQDQQSEVGHGTTIELRATWRLDRLLFDSRELQAAGIDAARRRERRQLATRVLRAYFAWRRAQAAARRARDDDRLVSRVEETVAELDALTEGWFSREQSHAAGGALRAPASAKP